MTEFVPGLELARALYEEALEPALGGLPHGAALLGWGSDVLGLDDERSTDHGWGPRLQLFVEPTAVREARRRVGAALPAEVRGWPTRFGWDDVPLSDHVEVVTLSDWLEERLGLDPREGMTHADWLSTPQQRLLEVTAGAVFHDADGQLEALRGLLGWYPEDVWLWLLASQWQRIAEEEAFPGRAAEVGDELGERLSNARLVSDLVRLCFLIERRYAPYGKWLGSMFRRLPIAATIGPPLLAALGSARRDAREEALAEALGHVAARHNELGLTAPVDASIRLFHGRPFRVLGAERFARALLERVGDPWLRALPLAGGVDQLAGSSAVVEEPRAFRAARAQYESWGAAAGEQPPAG